MPTTYKNMTVPLSSDLADGPAAFRDYTDTLETRLAANVPAGTLLHTVMTAAPTGWLLMNGAAVTNAQTLYPALWAVIPVGWKSGSTMNLPDCRGRFVVALNPANAIMDAAGEQGGAVTKNITIAGGNLPAHTHTQQGSFGSGGQSANHDHGIQRGISSSQNVGGGIWDLAQNTSLGYSTTQNENQTHGHVTTISGETGNGPGAATPIAVDVTPPFVAFNLMIRAF